MRHIRIDCGPHGFFFIIKHKVFIGLCQFLAILILHPSQILIKGLHEIDPFCFDRLTMHLLDSLWHAFADEHPGHPPLIFLHILILLRFELDPLIIVIKDVLLEQEVVLLLVRGYLYRTLGSSDVAFRVPRYCSTCKRPRLDSSTRPSLLHILTFILFEHLQDVRMRIS